MADDSQKPAGSSQANIDDLVKELSRSQGAPSPAPSAPAANNNPSPTSAVPPRPTPPTSAPATVPKPAPVAPSTAPAAPKDYQSSIRTMTDDLAKLKAGQQPQGTNIPRTVPSAPATVPKPAPVAPSMPPKPAAPSPGIPPVIKPAPLPPKSTPSPIPAAPISPARPQTPSSVMPPIPASPAPSAAAPTPKPATPTFPTPAGSSSSSRRTLALLGVLLLVIVLGGLYWYFMIHSTPADLAESPIPTFTPRPTATENPDFLGSIFTVSGSSIVLPKTGDMISGLASGVAAEPNATPGTLVSIKMLSGTASSSVQDLSLTDVLDYFHSSYPAGLKTALGNNQKILVYGQKESFNKAGKPVTNTTPVKRLVYVSEISPGSEALLKSWEDSMPTSLSPILAFRFAKDTGSFMETSYKEVYIRFKNFLFPDQSIDYAIVYSQDKTYLVIAGSREAMFATIDSFIVKGK
jgi:hypothetical protein